MEAGVEGSRACCSPGVRDAACGLGAGKAWGAEGTASWGVPLSGTLWVAHCV